MALTPVDYDPFAAKPRAPPPAARGPKLTPVDHDPFGADAPRKAYPQTSSFDSEVDGALGKGKWKATGGYRSPQREDQLRAQGAGTVTPGRLSNHSRGSPDAPGAYDLVANDPGAVDRLRRLPGVKDAFYEGARGSQGGHIHVDTSDVLLTPVDHDPFAQTPSAPQKAPAATQPPKLTPVDHDPFAGAKGYLKEEFESQIMAPAKKVAEDFTHPYKAPPVHNPWDVVRGIAGEQADSFKNMGDAATLAMQAAGGGLIHAGVVRPLAEAGKYIPMPTQIGKKAPPTQAEREKIWEDAIGTSLMGAGPEAGRLGLAEQMAAKETIPTSPNFGKPSIPKAPTAPRPQPTPGRSLKSIFSPATLSDDSRAAASLHRSIMGKWNITSDRENYLLNKHAKAVGKLSPEDTKDFIDYVERRSEQGVRPPDAPRHDLGPGQEYGEGRAPRTPQERARAKAMNRVQNAAEDTPLRKAADAIRDLSDRYKARIQYALGTEEEGGPQFIKDYFAHMWKEDGDTVVKAMSLGGKQGAGGNLRARSIPTYSEGLARGLTPRFPNPIDAMMAYNENMARFLKTHEIKDTLVDTKLPDGRAMASWHFPGQAPDGYVPLEGMMTKRVPRGMRKAKGAAINQPKPGEPQKALPPPGERGLTRPGAPGQGRLSGPPGEDPGTPPANFRGGDLVPQPGARPQGQVGAGEQPLPIEDAAAKARRVESETQAEKPVKRAKDRAPIYQQLYAPEDVARIYNNHIRQGLDKSDGVGPLYRGARAVANSVSQTVLGLSAFHASVMGQEGIVSEVAQGLQQASKGDLRGLGRMAASPAAPVRLAMRGGRMKRQILGESLPDTMDERLNRIYERAGGQLGMSKIYGTRGSGSFFTSLTRGTLTRDIKDSLRRVVGPNPSAFDRAAGVVDLAGNVIQSAAAPIFEKFVPATKRGAWARRMEQYLGDNPNASDDEIVKKGREVMDSVDNRFGELMADNNFWNKIHFQIGQLLLLSPSWDIGTVREVGGGFAEIPKSVKGLAQGKGVTDKTAYVAALLGVTAIQNAVGTYLHTGQMPHGMDFLAYRTGGTAKDGSPERAMLPSYMKDILSFIFEGPGKLVTNKVQPALREAYELANNKDYRGYPITSKLPGEKGVGSYLLEQNTPISLQKASKGTGLNPVERMMGVKPAPGYIQNPERRHAMDEKYSTLAHKRKRQADMRRDAQ